MELNDLKEMLAEFKSSYGYKIDVKDKDPHLFDDSVRPETISIKDEQMILMFEYIISHIEDYELHQSGYYDV